VTNPIPDSFTAWSQSGCTQPGCGTEDTETLSVAGRRCAAHPPTFDPKRAVELAVDGWADTAMAYCRWSA
jgi:hypothetical protein